jgi:ATP-dependent Clp protease ATP-binding subunit ClpA
VLGPAGSGKTQILEAFFSAAAHGSVPEVPRTMRVLRVDRSSLTAGNQYVGNFESRVGTLRAAAGYVPIIILADEMHSLRGAGTGKASNVDFFDMVKTDLADGTMRIAGTDTAAEFYAAFGGDSAILRRVQTVNRPVMGRARTLAAMDSWIARYRLPAISPEVRDFAYLASERFVAIGAQPSKATALLDRAYSRHRTVNGSTAPLTREAIIETLVSMGVDPLLFDEGGADASIARIDNGWNELVIGQTATRGALRTQEFARLNDLRDTRRIAISVLVVGTFGTGKTLSGTAFAQLTGRPSRVLNMADYPDSQLEAFKRLMVQQQRENAFTLYIADEIHLAGRQVQAFLQAILENGVLELPDYVGPAGTTPTATTFVDFRNAGIYATTNAGMEAVARHYAAPAERPIQIGFGLGGSAVPEAQARLTSAMAAQRDEVVRNQALRGAIAEGGIIPALVNRFVHVVPSQTATREQFREIVGLELRKYLRQIEASRGLRITFENEAAFLDAATDVYFDPTAGNRVIRLAIERHVSNALNEGLARIPAIEGSPVRSVTARFNLETGLAELGPDCEGLMLGAR